ncbi:MAG TPA: hypothetical protein PL001_11280, partial [Candidatus Kryptobacter bacterium]|nr:hypothetical protein [Candidatus Kryptobacter bacterium]
MANEDKTTRTDFQIQLDNMSVNEILAFVNVLRIIQPTQKFREWIRSRYPSVDFDPLYEGYQYLALSSFNCILDAVLTDDLLNLKEDYTFRRARHEGLKFDKVPNTCEKTIFIKRILTYTQKIKAAKNWQQLEDGLKDLDELLSIFEEITVAYCLDKSNLEDKRNKAAQLYVYDKLLDTREYAPRAVRVPIFDMNLQIPYLKRAFDGYVYCLEYIWFSLLGES